MQKIENGSPIQVVHFTLQNMYACINLQNLVRILPLALLEPVPGAPDYLVGLLNLGGQSVPIIDLTIRLGIPRKAEYTIETPVLLCADQANQVGIIVDQVLNLTLVTEKELQMHHEFNMADSPFIGAVLYDSKMSLLLDIKKIIEDAYFFKKIQKKDNYKKDTTVNNYDKHRS